MKKYEKQTDKDLLVRIEALRRKIDELEVEDEERMSADFMASRGGDYFQVLVEYSTDMISVLNADGTIRYVNPATERISGYKSKELIGRNALDFVHPDEVSNVADTFKKISDIQGNSISIESRLQCKDGSWIDVDVSVTNSVDNPLVEGLVINCRDISESKRIEQQIKEREEKLLLLIETSNDVVYIVDSQGIVTYIGPQVIKYGYTQDEVINKSMMEFIDSEDHQKVMSDFMNSMNSGVEFPAEFRLVDTHGKKYWVEDRGRVQRDDYGNIVGLTGMLRDITNRKQAEQNLNQSKVITDNIDEALVVFSMDRTLTFVNPAYEKITGWSSSEIIGKNGAQLAGQTIAERDVKRIRENFETLFHGGDLPPIETCFKNKDGREIPVELTAFFVRDEQGNRIQLVAVISDITERRQAEHALRESESRFRTIFERVKDNILYLDNKGIIMDINSRVEDIFGYKIEDVIGKNFVDVGIIKPQHLQNMSQQFSDMITGERQPGLTHLEIIHKNGKTIFVEASVTHFMQENQIEGLVVVARDVTERKLAQTAIRNREAEYSSLVELSPDGIIVMKGHELIYLNKRASEIFEYPISECIGRDVIELFVPNIPDILKEDEKKFLIEDMVKSLEDNNESRTYTIPIKNDSGDTLWIEINSSPAQYRDESVRLAFMRNVTERKQWEVVLQESEDKFKTIFENANDEIVYMDMNGIIVDRNIKGEDITGYTFDEVIGKRIDELAHVLPRSEMSTMTQLLRTAMGGTGGQGMIEVELIHKNGSLVLAEASISLFKRGEEIEGILVILRDITERKQAEAQILQRNRELAALSSIAQSVSQTIDLDEILNSALDKTLDILNIKHGSVHLIDKQTNTLELRIYQGIDYQQAEVISTINPGEGIVGRVANSGEPVFFEVKPSLINSGPSGFANLIIDQQLKSVISVPIKAKGEVLGVLSSFTQGERAFTAEEKDLLTTIAHQISAAIENAQLIEEASRAVALEETDRLRTAFLASVSHEMRTPMTSIKGLASTLVQPDVEWDSETQHEFLMTIDQESDRLLHIVSDVLDMSKIEAGAMKLDKSLTNLNRVISQLSTTFFNITAGHSLEFLIPPDLPSILIDEVRIGQVISNLVENAASYSPAGTKITLEAWLSDRRLFVSITDYGEGILPEHQKKVFDHFYRLEENVKRKKSGSGLGLAICKGIVDSHNGNIWVESNSGRGSKFVFSLPLTESVKDVD